MIGRARPTTQGLHVEHLHRYLYLELLVSRIARGHRSRTPEDAREPPAYRDSAGMLAFKFLMPYDPRMAEKIVVYEKPTCSKCREVKRLLNDKGVEFEAINYFEQGLTADKLEQLLRAAGLKPEDAIRKNEPAYKEFVAGKGLGQDDLIRTMAAHPELIQRPIVVRGKKAVLARPVENLCALDL